MWDVDALTIYLFGFIALLSFLKLFFQKSLANSRIFEKILGGMVVLMTAIISDSVVVFGMSIFVGGLIIASEDFMKFLAAIFRTRSDKIAETLTALALKDIDSNQTIIGDEAITNNLTKK